MRFTTRLILAAVLLAVSTTTATAGPIRDRLAARFNRPTQTVQYQPQPQPQPQYQPTYTPGPIQQVAANVLTGTGQIVQNVGQAVYQLPVIRSGSL